jgi:hypothetical protein
MMQLVEVLNIVQLQQVMEVHGQQLNHQEQMQGKRQFMFM